MSQLKVTRQRAIIDRRALATAIEEVIEEHGAEAARQTIVELLRAALDKGRQELTKRLADKPAAGHEITNGYAFLVDQIIRVVHDHVTGDLYPVANRTAGERLALLAVGGYGRGEMAPYSDVDIAFITPAKPTAWCEQVIEAMLYFLWDLGLTVGHSSRSLDEMVRMAKSDLTIRTAILEGRYLWGDRDVYQMAEDRFWGDVVPGSEAQFVTEKLAEREARHKRMGDSRYVVEPNVKDGKGGLRDLQTLYWIGKYVYRVRSAEELVDKGLFTQQEYRTFRRAEGFLLAVRSHLHTIAKRGEDRLTFDLQREVAKRMNYADRPGKSAVERFMQFYFLQAQHVGNLTGIFLAQLEERTSQKKVRRGGLLDRFINRRERTTVEGYMLRGNKLSAPDDRWFRDDPVRLVEVFTIAEREGLEIHPETIRMARRDAGLIQGNIRKDERANAAFLELLSGRKDPETVLRWMNEAGVFGRFIPDFGKVGGQMQFDMYHHYTVDEHTIRAIGLLSQIERGELEEDHPLATRILPGLKYRRALYVATLLHDIAKGRGGDHSVLGAELALRICPRMGLTKAETELVSWLVRYHLLMSATAFKRDLSDPKTIEDFVEEVDDLEHLGQLTVLTIVDIRAVGPGIWNSWKRQLLGELYTLAEENLRLGEDDEARRQKRFEAKRAAVAELLGDEHRHLIGELDSRFDRDYWMAEPADIIAINLPHYAAAKRLEDSLSIHTEYYPARGATLITVMGDDHPGLFFRIAGAISLAGANIIDARIHTTKVGKAVDNFLVQDPLGKPFKEEQQLTRLKKKIEDALMGKIDMVGSLAARPLPRTRAEHFRIAPLILFDNEASERFTVIEVNATDRPALLNRLTRAMFECSLIINSAHITQYGERAVDTFYVTDLLGDKIYSKDRLAKVEQALLDAIAAGEPKVEAAE
ncbi:[protein-PII] uridylyltransferase [Alteraurantiacibacter aquimixticola]|uniref:Bifunctional uridylyltransferase/uridylyl-removing enzyme n=1 Tax=Alteraurantiacibacter aquimixticola TaxID=2489173 RepID=A0A4T3EWH2_9SPHN|nr:[protein-PII] uridylyltransferase [Alteraurantiacibacter aquimixticola]TIX48905.1 [protein-PII] uridylyltransferase [Alteraurantiacibacter aquimixticola]